MSQGPGSQVPPPPPPQGGAPFCSSQFEGFLHILSTGIERGSCLAGYGFDNLGSACQSQSHNAFGQS